SHPIPYTTLFRSPQPVRGIDAESKHRRVVRGSLHHVLWNPLHSVPAFGIAVRLGVAAELDIEADLRFRNLPWVAQTEPTVGDLHLPAVTDFLIEDAELVTDAVADSR